MDILGFKATVFTILQQVFDNWSSIRQLSSLPKTKQKTKKTKTKQTQKHKTKQEIGWKTVSRGGERGEDQGVDRALLLLSAVAEHK